MSIERYKGTGLVKFPAEFKAFMATVEHEQEKLNKIILRATANCREAIRLAAIGELPGELPTSAPPPEATESAA